MVIHQHTTAWMWMKDREDSSTLLDEHRVALHDLRGGVDEIREYSSSGRFRWMKKLPRPAWSLRGGPR